MGGLPPLLSAGPGGGKRGGPTGVPSGRGWLAYVNASWHLRWDHRPAGSKVIRDSTNARRNNSDAAYVRLSHTQRRYFLGRAPGWIKGGVEAQTETFSADHGRHMLVGNRPTLSRAVNA